MNFRISDSSQYRLAEAKKTFSGSFRDNTLIHWQSIRNVFVQDYPVYSPQDYRLPICLFGGLYRLGDYTGVIAIADLSVFLFEKKTPKYPFLLYQVRNSESLTKINPEKEKDMQPRTLIPCEKQS